MSFRIRRISPVKAANSDGGVAGVVFPLFDGLRVTFWSADGLLLDGRVGEGNSICWGRPEPRTGVSPSLMSRCLHRQPGQSQQDFALSSKEPKIARVMLEHGRQWYCLHVAQQRVNFLSLVSTWQPAQAYGFAGGGAVLVGGALFFEAIFVVDQSSLCVLFRRLEARCWRQRRKRKQHSLEWQM